MIFTRPRPTRGWSRPRYRVGLRRWLSLQLGFSGAASGLGRAAAHPQVVARSAANRGDANMQKQWIVSNPKVMMGKPVIAGTRITVELILEKLAAGETIEQILEAHPHLTREAILAALAFARDALRADVVYPLAETPA